MNAMEDKQRLKWGEDNHFGCCVENGSLEEKEEQHQQQKWVQDVTTAKCRQGIILLWTRIVVGKVVEIRTHIY